MRKLLAAFVAFVTLALGAVAIMTAQPADKAWDNLRTWIPDHILENIWPLTLIAALITFFIIFWPNIRNWKWLHHQIGLREDGTWSWQLRAPWESLSLKHDMPSVRIHEWQEEN